MAATWRKGRCGADEACFVENKMLVKKEVLTLEKNKKVFESFQKGEIFTWMPIIGFDREAEDKGVDALIERMGFVPHGVSVFMFHPDIIHFHAGLEHEVAFPPDFCAYYANPYNEERRRQEWSNYDLKTLADKLNEAGTEAYLGIMGVDLENKFHQEWLSEHPEVKNHLRHAKWSLHVLKRMADGSYYEDFFADQVCRILADYGFAGLHVTDNFCPQGSTLYCGDFSRDMLEQFAAHSGITIPEDITAHAEDSFENINRRGDWIWENCRAEWISFYAWRWEQFWKKICTRLHAIGKKVIAMGTYCTDPFETLYCKGVDLRSLVRAGVDYLMPNTVPNGVSVVKARPYKWYEYMAMAPLTDAFADGGKALALLGVKDASEEWDLLHHTPVLLERDIHMLPAWFRNTGRGMKRCIDGLMICLGDGIYGDEWKWLSERFDTGFCEVPQAILLPTLVWSDSAFYNMLPEYIKTRRWTLHKFMYEMMKRGAYTGAVVRTDNLEDEVGALFVPNFDLLNEEEKWKIAAYQGGAVICTASAEKNFSPIDYGIQPDIYFEDTDVPYRNCTFAYGMEIEDKNSILSLLKHKDNTEVLEDPFHAEESRSTLTATLPYQKVSAGYINACCRLLKEASKNVMESTHPVIPMRLEDGRVRLYVVNDDRLNYGQAVITMKHDVEKVCNVSRFPLLPVKFTDDGTFNFMSRDYPGQSRTFRVLIPPGGVSIVDVCYKQNELQQ